MTEPAPSSPQADTTSGAEQAQQMVADAELGSRRLPGAWSWLVAVLAAAWSIFQLAIADFILLPSEVVRSVHLAFAIGLVYLCYPTLKSQSRLGQYAARVPILRFLARTDRPPIIDVVLGVLAVGAACYYVWFQADIAGRHGKPSVLDIVAGTLLIVFLLEAARRALGLALPLVALGFMLLSFLSEYLGPVAWKATGFTQLINKVAIGTEGILGVPLDVSATMVFLFVLFGTMLDKAGAGEWFIRLALALVGRFRGGAAKAAVLASGFTGIVSGSSIANTVTTGTFTIPLMKRTGYPAVKAGAIEVAASTNGQLMPPIMGAAAFIIAEYCGLPYTEVIMAAAVPAIISYLALLYITHLEACKLGLQGMPASDRPAIVPTLIQGIPYAPPLGLLIYMLVFLEQTPGKSALYAILCLIAVMLIQGAYRGVRAGNVPVELKRAGSQVISGLVMGARNMTGIGVAVAAAGVIVAVVSLGLDGKIVELIGFLSGGQLWLLLILTAAASLILGLGLPTTANYIVMATLTVPIIVEQGAAMELAVPLIAAHLFCFYFGILADDTPPVGLAAYAASAISRADPIRTGMQGFTYDMRTAILPFAFLFNTELLLIGIESFWHGAVIVVTGMAAMLAFANATQGWLRQRCLWWERILLLVVVVVLLRPDVIGGFIPVVSRSGSYVLGLLVYAAIYAGQWVRKESPAATTVLDSAE